VRTLSTLLAELLWLAGAAVFAWFFLFTFLGIEGVAAVVTLALRKVERSWQ